MGRRSGVAMGISAKPVDKKSRRVTEVTRRRKQLPRSYFLVGAGDAAGGTFAAP